MSFQFVRVIALCQDKSGKLEKKKKKKEKKMLIGKNTDLKKKKTEDLNARGSKHFFNGDRKPFSRWEIDDKERRKKEEEKEGIDKLGDQRW